jgi:hypothetical protein
MHNSADIPRLRRLAAGLHPDASVILDHLIADKGIKRLVYGAELGMPPVMLVPDLLPENVRPALKEDRIRRFVGTVVAAVLSGESWIVERTGVRVPDADSYFSTGAIYMRAPAAPPADPAETDYLLDAMIAGLSAAQRQALITRIQALGS